MKYIILLVLVTLYACGSKSSAPTQSPDPPPPPAGPVPIVRTSLGVGESPVEGEVSISPVGGSEGWRYAIDLDEDGVADQAGVLDLGIGFRYRFDTPGVHRIEVVLTGPAGRQELITIPVVVNDTGPIRILAEGRVELGPDEPGTFEGIAADHAGDAIYVATFRGGELFRLDVNTLEVTGRIRIGDRVEGLAITPSDRFLYAAFKGFDAASVDLESFTLENFFDDPGPIGNYFVAALEDGRALIGGEGPLGLVDMETGVVLDRFRTPGREFTDGRHFDIAPDGQTAAVITRGNDPELHIMDLATLQSVRELPVGQLTIPQLVAFGPRGDRLYVFGRNEDDAGVFVVIAVTDSRIIHELVLGSGGCGSFCVANPTATSMSGRYIAVEWQSSAYIIDTETDLPEHAFLPFGQRFTGGGLSVASSPNEDVFYFLSSGGSIYKVAIEE